MNTNPSATLRTGVLYYGDNLEVLRKHIPDASVDLIYLDPPFNSQATYNVLFKEPTGELSAAQLRAFSDTWHWDLTAEQTFKEIVEGGPPQVAKMISALRDFIGRNDMMAYLVMMTVRLVELRRVLAPTGSLYLHCDPTASHYLKMVLDTIFGKQNFRNEIVWKRTSAHGDIKQGARHFGRVHDIILRYSKGNFPTRNPQYSDYDTDYVETFYRHVEPDTGRRFQAVDLTARKPGGDTLYEWKGKRPYRGRYWAYSKANMEEFERQGRLYYTKTGMPRLKYYLDEMPGMPVQDIWHDIPHTLGKERLGYETQKPLALLERIVSASSNPGDVVLDPFCGCGTAVVAAHKLGRAWIGIDITHLAITVMKKRLEDSFGLKAGADYQVIGEPVDLSGARALAEQDRYQFQWWALSLVGASPSGGRASPVGDQKKGADRGVDGVIGFMEAGGRAKHIVVQVKSGHVNAAHIRDLKGTVERERAELGLFITLEPATEPMRQEALSAGFYPSELWQRDYQRLQICTIQELLAGRGPQLPRGAAGGFAQASREKKVEMEQGRLGMVLKYKEGDRVIGKARGAFLGRRGTIESYEPGGQYWVQFDDGRRECVPTEWLNPEPSLATEKAGA